MRLGSAITAEMGKPIAEAEAEIDKCAWACEFYASNGHRFLEPAPVQTDAEESFVSYDPLGVILAILPWNYPFWQFFRCAAAILMSGNVVLLKHAPNVTGCALAIQEVFRSCGAPPGLVQAVVLGIPDVERLIGDPRVQAVTLTGSEAAGARVATIAGQALKKTVMELGGSDPFIVLGDADVERAVAAAVWSRFQNAGQSCIAAKRFVVVNDVADEFEQRLVEHAALLRVGDPTDRSVDLGPLARADLLDALHAQVRESVDGGARLLLGGEQVARRGFFYEPTVLADVLPDTPGACQETFGPVAALIRVTSVRHAVHVANSTRYGLGASIWTRDLALAREIASEIQSGLVFVNEVVGSDPRLPFGGVKHSGYGRELGSFGMQEFTNVRTTWVTSS